VGSIGIKKIERKEREGTDNIEPLTTVMNGHVTAFPWVIAIGKELTHEVFEGETSLLKDPGFSILGEDYIFWN
jgi:hypothetical protein